MVATQQTDFYKVLERKLFYIVQFKSNKTISKQELQKYNEKMIEIIMAPKDIVVDFFYADEFIFSLMLPLYILNQILETTGNKIRFVNAKHKLETKMLLSIFSEKDLFSEDLNDAILTLAPCNAQEVGFNFLKALVVATVKTMFIQAHVPCTRRKTYFKEESKNQFLAEIVSITRVKTTDYSYFFSISFDENTFLKMMSQLLMEEVTEVDDDNIDGVAELANIILGQTKNIFNLIEKSEFGLGRPQVHRGKECPSLKIENELFDWQNATIMVIPFASNWGGFFIELFFPKELSQEEIQKIILS